MPHVKGQSSSAARLHRQEGDELIEIANSARTEGARFGSLRLRACVAGNGSRRWQRPDSIAGTDSHTGEDRRPVHRDLPGRARAGRRHVRKEAKGVGLKFTERFEYKRLFKGVAFRSTATTSASSPASAASRTSIRRGSTPSRRRRPPSPDLATAIKMTGADLAQAAGYTGAGVKVAVMDTGIDVDHQDLGGDGSQAAPQSFPNSRWSPASTSSATTTTPTRRAPAISRFRIPTPLPDDCNGHGTHVSGIVGANDGAVTGVAPDVTFGAYRVFGCDGSTTDDVMIAAMERALADGMDVLNMSIGDAFNNWAARRPPPLPTRSSTRAWSSSHRSATAAPWHLLGRSARRRGEGDRCRVVRQQSHPADRFKISPDNLAIPFTMRPLLRRPDVRLDDAGEDRHDDDARRRLHQSAGGGIDDGHSRPDPPRILASSGAGVQFHAKALAAQSAGAAAVVIYNNVPGFATYGSRFAGDHDPRRLHHRRGRIELNAASQPVPSR